MNMTRQADGATQYIFVDNGIFNLSMTALDILKQESSRS